MSVRSVSTTLTRLASVGGAQSVPLGGVLGADWTPATGLALFWIESALLALVAVTLAALVAWDARRASARARGIDAEAARAAAQRHDEIRAAHIVPRDVFAFHVGSLMVFGLFLAGFVFMLSQQGEAGEGIYVDPDALLLGGSAILGFVTLGAMGELIGHRRLPAADVAARVDACTGRWVMFWLLGFAGPILVSIFGRPALFFAFFGGLKALWEVGRLLSRGTPVPARRPLYP